MRGEKEKTEKVRTKAKRESHGKGENCTRKGVSPGSEGSKEGISFLLGWAGSYTRANIIFKKRKK